MTRPLQPRTRCAAAVGAAGTILGLVLASPAGAAVASSSVDVIDRETVRALLDTTGKVTDAKLLEQITLLGNGKVALLDPTSGKGVRDLDGFSAPDVKDGKAVYNLSVDGRKDLRTLSDFTGTLPVTVSVIYRLDGEQISASDLVGRSGDLQVQYTVTNVTSAPTEVTYLDAFGKTVTKTVDAVTPFVGKIDTTLPSSFTDVDAPTASVGGDGRGGTGVSFNMVLFPPIGTAEQVMTWRAHVRNATLPAADVTVVPAAATRTEVSAATASFAGGAKGAGDLTVGANAIDANLLKLQAGAGDLLAGLSQLAAGAGTLSTGLNGKAAPGAKKLAAGAGTLAGGTGTLADGTGKLAAGTGKLAPGAAALADGAGTLAGKLELYQGGLTKLNAGISALPANEGLAQLKAGIAGLSAGIGAADKPGTIIYGLTSLKSAVSDGGRLKTGLQSLQTGITTLQGKIATAVSESLPALAAKADSSFAKLQALAATNSCLTTPAAACADILPALQDTGYLANALDAHAPGSLAAGDTTKDPGGLQYQLNAAAKALDGHAPGAYAGGNTTLDPGGVLYGLGALLAGIDGHAPGALAGGNTTLDPGGMLYALNAMLFGLNDHTPGTAGATDKGGVLYGLGAVSAGVDSLVQAVVTSVAGALGTATSDPTSTLRGGAAALTAGAAQIAGGAGALADGAADLDAGAGALDAGAGKLDAGADQLAAGAKELSTGLDTAASGAGRLADGLGKAAPGAAEIEAGAGQLSKEGTSVLASKGAETQAVNAEKAATLVAMGQKVAKGALPYGAPEGATGTAVYKLQLAAATTAGADNGKRGAAVAVLLGLACLGGALVRRATS